MSARDLRGAVIERGPLDQWLPAERVEKPYEFEFRMVVRTASIALTLWTGTRTAVPISEALSGFGMLAFSDRPLFRLLSRHTARGQKATAELRGEDAAEALDLLRAQRVLVEPASMELRFADETIEPRLELELLGDDNIRVKVGFFQENSSRRFSLNNGAWFEGTPCYHIDTTEGIVRELEEHVSPVWLQRIFRSPHIISEMTSLPRLIAEDIPVAASLQARLQIWRRWPRSPIIIPIALRVDGDMVDARARIFVTMVNASSPCRA